MSFNDPFFRDPDYMEKQRAKMKRTFWITAIIMILGMTSLWGVVITASVQLGQEIQSKGGLGKSIGRFLQDVQNPDGN